MDRIVRLRRRVLPALALLLGLGLWPAATGQAMPPELCEMPAGDPGDGVLRPYESEPRTHEAVAQAATNPSNGPATGSRYVLVLVPAPGPAGQPWPLLFRLVPIE